MTCWSEPLFCTSTITSFASLFTVGTDFVGISNAKLHWGAYWYNPYKFSKKQNEKINNIANISQIPNEHTCGTVGFAALYIKSMSIRFSIGESTLTL